MEKIIYNNAIPFKGFVAINLFGLIFVRREYKMYLEKVRFRKATLLNHELIYTAQYKELLYVFFLLLYLLNYVINVFVYFNFKKAYKNICFEREAKDNEHNNDYFSERHNFAWFSYIFTTKIKKNN